jgi:Flp pilus assembly protein CpaB
MVFRRRVPRATILFLLAAIGCAFGAFAMMRGYAARLEALRPAVGPVVPVVVAAAPVERGATILSDDLRVAELPATVAPPGAFGDPAHAVGRTTLTAFGEGEAITPTRLVGGRGGPLAALVPPGLRAVPIVVQTVPAGLVRGDRIDVISTYGEGRMYSETVGHELEILVAPDAHDEGGATSVGVDGGGTQLVVLADTVTASRLARSSAASLLSIAVVGVDDG